MGPVVGTDASELEFLLAQTTSEVAVNLKLLLAANGELAILSRLTDLDSVGVVLLKIIQLAHIFCLFMLSIKVDATYDTRCLGLDLGNVKLAIIPVILHHLAVPLEDVAEFVKRHACKNVGKLNYKINSCSARSNSRYLPGLNKAPELNDTLT
jgi:hypothetical protein